MKCPKCGEKKSFRISCWDVTSYDHYVRIDEDGGYTIEETKTYDAIESFIWSNSTVRCWDGCKYEGLHAEFLVPGELPIMEVKDYALKEDKPKTWGEIFQDIWDKLFPSAQPQGA